MASEQSETGAGRGLDEWLRDLADPAEEVRKAAVQALGRDGDASAIEPLKRLLNDPSVSLRFLVRKTIGLIERRLAGLDTTQAPLASPRLPHTGRPAAAPAGDDAAGRTFERWRELLALEDPEARLAAVVESYDVQTPELLGLLARMFETEQDPAVRSALASALGRYRDPRVQPMLFRALEDPDSRVRANTVEALGRSSDPHVVEHLARLANDSDNRVQANLARALGRFDADLLHDQVSEMLSSASRQMRESAIYVLWAVRDEWSKGELEVLASDPNQEPSIRERARQYPAGLARLSRPMAAVHVSEEAIRAKVGPIVPEPVLEHGFDMPAHIETPAPPPVRPPPRVPPPMLPPIQPSAAPAPTLPVASPRPKLADLAEMARHAGLPAAAADEITSLQVMDLSSIMAGLEDRSAEVKLAALQQAAAFDDEELWQRIEMLSMEKNDRVREEARKLLKRRYGDDAVADLSSATLGSQRVTLDLSTSALKIARKKTGEVDQLDVTATATDLSSTTSTSSRATSRRAPKVSGRSSGVVPAQPARPGLGDLHPVAQGVAVLVVVLLVFVGLGKLALSEGPSTGAAQVENDRTASKLAQMTKAKDLGKFIGVAVQFSGQLLEAKDKEGRYVVRTALGNVAVQFVRPVSKPPAVNASVDVDGVLLGKTRESYLLFRGRKIQTAAAAQGS